MFDNIGDTYFEIIEGFANFPSGEEQIVARTSDVDYPARGEAILTAGNSAPYWIYIVYPHVNVSADRCRERQRPHRIVDHAYDFACCSLRNVQTNRQGVGIFIVVGAIFI